ncbi:hypothetical protein [Sphingomonas sp. Marseille-Q8236]
MAFTALVALIAISTPQVPDRKYEGDWYVSDTTDNNTGEREVYAFQTHIEKDDPYVTLSMRCVSGKPEFVVEWEDVEFPSTTALTIGPVRDADAEPVEKPYVFVKADPKDVLQRGLHAAPETSRSIIAALGPSKYATFTAHVPSRSMTVGIKVNGTQQAWARVIRHCPVKTLQRPPL